MHIRQQLSILEEEYIQAAGSADYMDKRISNKVFFQIVRNDFSVWPVKHKTSPTANDTGLGSTPEELNRRIIIKDKVIAQARKGF